MNRRDFIKGAVAIGTTAIISPSEAFAVNVITPSKYQKKLSFYNIHTQEHIQNIVFEENGIILQDSMELFNNLLRDRRTNEIVEIDSELYLKLFELQKTLRTKSDINVISGFRSDKTNEMLRKTTRGVAKRSYHTKGQAIDINMNNRKLSEIRKVSYKMRFGGIGYYPKSQFVHLDTGRFRTWRG